MKYPVEIDSGGMILISSFINIGEVLMECYGFSSEI
jgi:hypothetical protein